jgi:hypothetical protein
MVWFTIWFMVILKIPLAYFGYVMWWSLKDSPDAYPEPGSDAAGGGGPSHGPRLGRRGGPHGTYGRRLARRARRRAPA